MNGSGCPDPSGADTLGGSRPFGKISFGTDPCADLCVIVVVVVCTGPRSRSFSVPVATSAIDPVRLVTSRALRLLPPIASLAVSSGQLPLWPRPVTASARYRLSTTRPSAVRRSLRFRLRCARRVHGADRTGQAAAAFSFPDDPKCKCVCVRGRLGDPRAPACPDAITASKWRKGRRRARANGGVRRVGRGDC